MNNLAGKTVSELRELNAQGLIRRIDIREYGVWVDMKKRCNNPDHAFFRDYGGRGILVCPEWSKDFFAWLEHIGRRPREGLTLDRINNDKGYEPGNIRWAPMSVQNYNRRRDKNTKVTDEQVIEIRARRGIDTQRKIAFDFGISHTQVASIQLGKSRNPDGLYKRPPKIPRAIGERNLQEPEIKRRWGL